MDAVVSVDVAALVEALEGIESAIAILGLVGSLIGFGLVIATMTRRQ